jgi:hypothetical protein
MKFVVAGGVAYKVGVAAEVLRHGGRRAMGVWDEAGREVQISPHVPASARLSVVLHEMGHAWLRHAGFPVHVPPERAEAVCDWLATFAEATMKSLAINGGPAALLRLSPGESPQPGAARVFLTRGRACATCGGSVAAGSVSAVADGEGNVRLALYCEFCNATMRWTERADIHGQPSGETVGEPAFERGDGTGGAGLPASTRSGTLQSAGLADRGHENPVDHEGCEG